MCCTSQKKYMLWEICIILWFYLITSVGAARVKGVYTNFRNICKAQNLEGWVVQSENSFSITFSLLPFLNMHFIALKCVYRILWLWIIYGYCLHGLQPSSQS